MTISEEQRSALYAAIYSRPEVYRPPREEGSALLEVASGCSWAKCTFCDFIRDEFQIFPMDQILLSLKALQLLEPDNSRLFLLGQNAFCLSTERLLEIAEQAAMHLPALKEIAMYARVDDILRKSDEELLRLRKKGICDLHIGIESGSDSILALVNKGCTSFEIRDALSRLDKAGIGYYVTIVLGLGGRACRNLHALETARLLSQTHPKQIWALALKLWPDTPLFSQAKEGEFEQLTPGDILLEEQLLLQNLTLSNTFYMDTTVLGQYTLQGRLPEQKPQMLDAIQRLLSLVPSPLAT